MLGDSSQNYNSDIKRAITGTIAFFDLFDFPPTAREIRANLDSYYNLLEVIRALEECPGINTYQGQYFLSGRQKIIATRKKRYNYYCRKLKIARRFAGLFAVCPVVRAVYLSNTIGSHNLRDDGDIDFFIIAAPGKIWQARLYCAGLAALLNKRPKKNNKRDKICLSFYVSADQLNLSHLKLQPADPYFDYWLRNLVLLYNRKRTHESFLVANKPGLPGSKDNYRGQSFPEKIGIIERFSRALQLAIMNPALKEAAKKPSGVVINNQTLKLYLKDSRQEYLQKYGDKLQQIFAQND